ncbi:hypothetical protein ACFODT_17000, partial [Vibrio zhugei]
RAYHFQQLASSSTYFHECRTYYLKSGFFKAQVYLNCLGGSVPNKYKMGSNSRISIEMTSKKADE